MKYLEKTGLDEKTIVIITADHGEEFLDHEGYWHGCTLYNELLRVPLIVHLPSGADERFSERVSTIDIFPTIFELMDDRISTDNDGAGGNFTGQSLVPLMLYDDWDERPIFSGTAFRDPLKYSLIKGGYKFMKYAQDEAYKRSDFEYEPGQFIGLYNINDDPMEQDNLLESNPGLAE